MKQPSAHSSIWVDFRHLNESSLIVVQSQIGGSGPVWAMCSQAMDGTSSLGLQ